MRIKILFSILLIFVTNIGAQTHFTSVDQTGKPYHIIIQKATIDGNGLKAGDEIAAFDGNLCVGNVVLISDNQNNIDLVTWEGEPNYGLTGFTSGDSITIKIWSNIYGTYHELDAKPVFVQGDGTFGYGTYSTIILSETPNIFPVITFSTTNLNLGEATVGSSINGFFTIYNRGNANLTVSNIVTDNNVFSVLGSRNFMVAPEDSHQVVIRFQPNEALPETSILTVFSNSPGHNEEIINLNAQGVPANGADIQISVNELDFGNVNVGNIRRKNFQITNYGNEILSIYSIYSSNSRFIPSTSNLSIPPGESKVVQITFIPSSVGNVTGSVYINSNSNSNSQLSMSVSGYGFNSHFDPVTSTGIPYNILVNNVEIDNHGLTQGDEIAVFDNNICVGTNIYRGEYPVVITAWKADQENSLIGYTEGDSIRFSLFATTWGGEHELEADVNWVDGNGTYGYGAYSSALLNINSNLEPVINVEPDSLLFGNIQIGEIKNLPLSVYNNGRSNLIINNISSTLHGFLPSLNSVTISPNSSRQITVSFQPDSNRYYDGELILNSNDPASPQKIVHLTGVGLPARNSNIFIAENKIDFDPVAVGDTSEYQLTIYNNGSADLEIYSINSSDNNFSSHYTDLTISPNGSKSVTIYFIPHNEGSFNSLLNINSNSINNPSFQIDLSGEAFTKFFNVVHPTGLPYSIIFNRISFSSDITPSVGDQIAIFDSALCVGLIPVTNIDPILYKEVVGTVWGENNGLPGFRNGKEIELRYFSKNSGKVYMLLDTLIVGDGNFGTLPYTSFNCEVTNNLIQPVLITQIPDIVTYQDSSYTAPGFGLNTYFSHQFVDLQYSINVVDTTAIMAEILNSTGLWIKPKDDWYGNTQIIVIASDGYFEAMDTVNIRVEAVKPEKVILSGTPSNGSIGVVLPVELHWRPSNRAEEYHLQLSLDSLFNTISLDSTGIIDTSVVLTTLDNLSKYYWRVAGYNPAGESDWSDVWNFKTIGEPTTATLLNPESDAVNVPIEIDFLWTKAADQLRMIKGKNLTLNIKGKEKGGISPIQSVSNYWFQLTKDVNGDPVISDDALTDTTKHVTGLENNTEYWWRVSAKNEAGWGSWTEWSHFTTIIDTPDVVILSDPQDGAINQPISLTLRWNTSERATEYRVQLSKRPDFINNIVLDDTTTSNSIEVIGLENSTHYYWRVKAKNIGGESDWSTVFGFTTIIDTPAVVELLLPENNSIGNLVPVSLLWHAAELASSYSLQVSLDTSFSYLVVDTSGIIDTTFILDGLINETTYYWRVKAENIGGESSWSDTWNFEALTFLTHNISLNQGWNMISSYILPSNTDLDTLCLSILDNLILLKNGFGKVYIPNFGINQIGNWNYLEGYKLYLQNNDSLNISGLKIRPEENPIILETGWNMFPYFLDDSSDVSVATGTIAGSVVLVKDINGNVYIPEFGINTICNMIPGMGYKAFLSKEDTLIYSYGHLEKTIAHNRVFNLQHFPETKLNTGNNSTLIINTDTFPDESEVCVKSLSGKILGVAPVSDSRAVVTVWGDNSITKNKIEGASPNEELMIVVWDKNKNREYYPEVGMVRNILTGTRQNILKYMKDGLLEVNLLSIIPEKLELLQNYPNPFNPTTTIEFRLPKKSYVDLSIYDILGSKVKTLISKELSEGAYKINFDASTLSSGVYFYSIKVGKMNISKKMILLK